MRFLIDANLTRDSDFADIPRYPPDRYSGIVVLRLPATAVAEEIAAVVKRFLSEPGFIASLADRLAVVEGDRVRFRPPLTLQINVAGSGQLPLCDVRRAKCAPESCHSIDRHARR
jgi:hypothetical protein